jgi:hypothetical protein
MHIQHNQGHWMQVTTIMEKLLQTKKANRNRQQGAGGVDARQ